MVSNRTVDITHLEWPLCLLQCNREIDNMSPGEEMEVIVDDPDVAEIIISLIKHMTDYKIKSDQTEACYRLHIFRRGEERLS